MNSIRAMTRRFRQTRDGAVAAAGKPINKRELKGTTTAVPLRQGEVEEDFETMTELAEHINPSMETSFMEIEARHTIRSTSRPSPRSFLVAVLNRVCRCVRATVCAPSTRCCPSDRWTA